MEEIIKKLCERIMHNIIILFILLCCLQINIAYSEGDIILDSSGTTVDMLRKFRTCSDASKLKGINIEGLANLKCSGSAEPSGEGFVALRKSFKNKKVIVVDLREESHGFLNKLYPVSWYLFLYNWGNAGKSLTNIKADESTKLQSLINKDIKLTGKNKKQYSTDISVKQVNSEEELANINNLSYIRFPVRDRAYPTDAIIDEFVLYVTKMPKDDTWFHFHCKEGKGRTTTFMVMFDMMHNADKVSFDDIIRRQYLIGGADLTEKKDDPVLQKLSNERLVLLKKFYDYCKNKNFLIPFSSFKK